MLIKPIGSNRRIDDSPSHCSTSKRITKKRSDNYVKISFTRLWEKKPAHRQEGNTFKDSYILRIHGGSDELKKHLATEYISRMHVEQTSRTENTAEKRGTISSWVPSLNRNGDEEDTLILQTMSPRK